MCCSFKVLHMQSSPFFNLHQVLKQHFILISVPGNPFTVSLISFFAICGTVMDYLDCKFER